MDDSCWPTTEDAAPSPAIQRGDRVRLREPYEPLLNYVADTVVNRMASLVVQRSQSNNDSYHTAYKDGHGARESLAVQNARSDTAYKDITQFTNGIVVAKLSRHSIETCTGGTHTVSDINQLTAGKGVVRTVGLHLFNPATGLMYLGRGDAGVSQPQCVEWHVGELRLLHRAGDDQNTTYDIPLWKVYERRYGLPDVFEHC